MYQCIVCWYVGTKKELSPSLFTATSLISPKFECALKLKLPNSTDIELDEHLT